MIFLKKHILIPILIVLLLLVGCGKGESHAPSEDSPVVAVSILPQETFVKKVCGDLVDTLVLIPPGYSPESYEPTPKEMTAFSRADVYFTVGVPAEEQNILPIVSGDTEIVSLAMPCAEAFGELTADGGRDPHIWLSIPRAALMVSVIADTMSELCPQHQEVFAANAQAYINELNSAHEEIADALDELKGKSFIVFHPSFGYFASDYGLEMLALEENGREATPQRMGELVQFAKENNIHVVFHQAQVDSRQSAAFAEEIDGDTVLLDPLASDYINNLRLMAEAIREGVG